MISKISTVGMSHDDWLKHRQNTIGGSDAAALCGMNSYMSPYSVWADKMGFISPAEDNEAMRLGRDLEQYVAERFTESTGKKVKKDNHIIFNSDYPYAHANVDRVVVGEDAGLECKTTSVLNLKKFKDGEYPDNYYAQCMHYMMVTGKKKWYLAVLILGKDFKVFEINRDENEIERLAETEEIFYKCVETGQPPSVDGSKATSETLSKVYPQSENFECDLSFFSSEIKEILSLNAQIKAITALKEQKINVIKEFMKTAERGSCGENKVTWVTSNRSSFDKKSLLSDYPSIDVNKYTKISTVRTFKIV